jgi:hypothetical protein
MKNNVIFARLLLVISLPLASSSFAMNQQQPAPPFAKASEDRQAQPDTMTMIRNVWGLIKQHPVISAVLGGGAALAAYKFATMKSGNLKKGKRHAPQNGKRAGAQNGVAQGLEFIMNQVQQAVQLYQEGKMPQAYLYKKYCEIARQSGIDALPQVERMALARAVIGFDVAFSGQDYESKRDVGIQAAVQGAYGRLAQVVQQLLAKYGEPRVKSAQPGNQAQAGGNSMIQGLMDQIRANPIPTLGLILSSGYSLLAQFNGWPPYGPQQPAQSPFAKATEDRPASAP